MVDGGPAQKNSLCENYEGPALPLFVIGLWKHGMLLELSIIVKALQKSGLISGEEEDESDDSNDCDRPALADSDLLQLFRSETEDEDWN